MVEESKVNASGSRGFDAAAAARTGKREIWVCFPIQLHNKRKEEYFKIPPSPVLFWKSFSFTGKMSMGVRTLLSAPMGSLYNVLIDFCLGIMDDTSALPRLKKDLPHLSL